MRRCPRCSRGTGHSGPPYLAPGVDPLAVDDDGIVASDSFVPIADHGRDSGHPRTTRPEWSSITPRLATAIDVAGGRRASALGLSVRAWASYLGRLTCLVLAVIEFAAWVLIAPPRSIESARSVADADNSTIRRCPGRADRGSGIRRSPAGGRWLPAPGPIVTGRTALLLHGFAEASSALEARRAAALNRHGWNVAVLDSRGYGQSGGPFRHSAATRRETSALARFSLGADRPHRPGTALSARALGPLDGGRHRLATAAAQNPAWRPSCSSRPWSTSTLHGPRAARRRSPSQSSWPG